MRELGGMTVGEFLSRVSMGELVEWQAIARMDAAREKRRGLERDARAGAGKTRRR